MPIAMDPAKRAAIVAAIEAGGTRNQISRDLGCSPSSVTRIAQEDDLDTSAWDRDAVKRAQGAKDADIAARKSELAGLLMDDAFDLRDRMWETQYQVVVVPMKGGGASTEVVAVPTSAADFRNYLTSIGIAVDKVGVLTRDDTNGLAAVDSWLRSLTGAETTA